MGGDEMTATPGQATARSSRSRRPSVRSMPMQDVIVLAGNRPPSKLGALSQSRTSRRARSGRAATASALAAAPASLCLCHASARLRDRRRTIGLRGKERRGNGGLGRSSTIAFETAALGEHVTRRPRKQSPARRRTERSENETIRFAAIGARWRRAPRPLFVCGRLVDPWEPRGADQQCDSCAARNLGRGEVPARTRSAGTNRSSDTIRTSSSTRSRLLAPTTHRTASAPARHQRRRWRQSHAAVSRVLARCSERKVRVFVSIVFCPAEAHSSAFRQPMVLECMCT